MTASLIQNITESFQEEYYDRHAKARKGFWGTVNQFFNFAEGSYNSRVLARFVYPALAFGGMAAMIAVSAPIVTSVVLGVAFAASAVSIASLAVVERESNKNLKADIANGTLLTRYAAEILAPQQAAVEAALAQAAASAQAEAQPPVIADVAPLTETFEAAAAPAAEAVPAPAVEAAPAAGAATPAAETAAPVAEKAAETTPPAPKA